MSSESAKRKTSLREASNVQKALAGRLGLFDPRVADAVVHGYATLEQGVLVLSYPASAHAKGRIARAAANSLAPYTDHAVVVRLR